MTDVKDYLRPELRPWRSFYGFAVLRLRVEIKGADRTPKRMAGDLVLARWRDSQPPMADGWLIHGIGFPCVMQEPDVEVVAPP